MELSSLAPFSAGRGRFGGWITLSKRKWNQVAFLLTSFFKNYRFKNAMSSFTVVTYSSQFAFCSLLSAQSPVIANLKVVAQRPARIEQSALRRVEDGKWLG